MKTQQGVNQRRLAGAVWPEKADGPPAQLAAQVLQNRPAAKTYGQIIEGDDAGTANVGLRIVRCCDGVIHLCDWDFVALGPDPTNSKSKRTLPRISQSLFLRKDCPMSSEIIRRVRGQSE